MKITKLQSIVKRYRDFLRLRTFILPYWKTQAFLITISNLAVPLGLVMPYLTKLTIDRAFANRDMALFIIYAILGAIIFILTAIIDGLNHYFEEKLNLRVNLDINSKLFGHIQRLSLRMLREKATGEHIYKLRFDSESVTGMITKTLPQIIHFIVQFLLVTAIVFYLNWKIALLSFFVAPIFYIWSRCFIYKRRNLLQEQLNLSQSIFVRLQEVFSHIHLVKAFGKEDFEISDFLNRALEKIKLSLKSVKLHFFYDFTYNSLLKVVLGTASVFGGYLIIKGKMSLGSFTALMIYLRQLVGLQSGIIGFFQQLTFNFISFDRVMEVLDTPTEIVDSPNAKIVKFDKADIEFKNVTFGYDITKPILKNLSFFIKAGSSIALVGQSGCGKTTLLNLMLRLYEPQDGSIFIAGHNIRDIKIDSLKDQVGIALQEPFLWNDTVENNIRYARQDASFKQIVEAVQLSGADSFIKMLPSEYKTNIGENAALISQGQKQRIAIARAVIKNPAIIILDEAMSSLDSESENKIIENIKTKFTTSTIIVVSHRLSTARKMDLLYFLESPDKISIGSYEELLARNSNFRELFASQVEPEKSYRA